MSKLVLGTAQFGLAYGINNKSGKIAKQEVFKILEYARKHDIDTLDTAYDYGSSEEVIGFYKPYCFKIISKLPEVDLTNVENIFSLSLKRLNADKIYGYLIHNFGFYQKHPRIWDLLQGLKEKKRIDKVGFSLYYPAELEFLLKNNIQFDMVQIPYNVFDQRFFEYFSILKKRHVEIYVRSIFLQGLVFKKSSFFNKKFYQLKAKIIKLNNLAERLGITIGDLCLCFILLNQNIDCVIIGIDCQEHLRNNLRALKYLKEVKNYYKDILDLKENNERIILPINW